MNICLIPYLSLSILKACFSLACFEKKRRASKFDFKIRNNPKPIYFEPTPTKLWYFSTARTWTQTVQFRWALNMWNLSATFYTDLSSKFSNSIFYIERNILYGKSQNIVTTVNNNYTTGTDTFDMNQALNWWHTHTHDAPAAALMVQLLTVSHCFELLILVLYRFAAALSYCVVYTVWVEVNPSWRERAPFFSIIVAFSQNNYELTHELNR